MAGCLAANETAAKVYYFLVFGLTVLVSWALRDYAQDALRHIPQIKTCFNNQVDCSVIHINQPTEILDDPPHLLIHSSLGLISSRCRQLVEVKGI